MRIPVLALPLLLAACDDGDDAQPVPQADDIAYAQPPGVGFARACAIERAGGGLVLRHPDSSFRRIVFTSDARRIGGDGAAAGRIGAAPGGETEIAIGARDRPPAGAVWPVR